MPELWFKVAWPDGNHEVCYSPSTVVRQYLQAGQEYPLVEFLTRVRVALEEASARVAVKYGYRCTSADDQLARIEETALLFQENPEATVLVLALESRADRTTTEAPS